METKCQRPGCTGTIVDGYCDTCGKPQIGVSNLNTPSSKATATVPKSAPDVSVRTASSISSKQVTFGSALSSRTGGARSTRSTRTSTRRQLGAGLVALEPVPSLDPMLSLMKDPVVPEGKRYCPNCQAKLSLEKGFCPMCGNEYSFSPAIKAGDLIAKQYEVKGPIAFGGLGWIYLGWDTVLSRWVVLKGLLNSKDAAGAAAAVAERQFLAAVKHPNIVGVYNFVTEGQAGYIVMEYVGGKTLKTMRKERGPLPVAEAIAYIHRILAAFGYLARMGMVYCDFKPDNFMIEDDDVKLIDMGGVRRADDAVSDVYGTKGYSAPEGGDSPTFVSDLYTVARTLAVLIMDFAFQGKYEHSLPPIDEAPVLAQNESLHRFLLKATRDHPDDRFQTADEMADQLLGVLRETVSTLDVPRPADSLHFGPDNVPPDDIAVSYQMLPQLKMDLLDPGVSAVLSMGVARTGAAWDLLIQKNPDSAEVPLRIAAAHIERGDYAAAERFLAAHEQKDPFDWRVLWYRGISCLAQGQGADAAAFFDRVYSEMPGELAPKLALAYASEMAGEYKVAAGLYDIVSRTDPNLTSAAFGLARCRLKLADKRSGVAAYKRVPAESIHYMQAQIAMTRALIDSMPDMDDLSMASQTLEALALDGLDKHYLSACVLLAAVERASGSVAAGTILGEPMQESALRSAAERELRACAKFVKTHEAKMALIDWANRERPVTLV